LLAGNADPYGDLFVEVRDRHALAVVRFALGRVRVVKVPALGAQDDVAARDEHVERVQCRGQCVRAAVLVAVVVHPEGRDDIDGLVDGRCHHAETARITRGAG